MVSALTLTQASATRRGKRLIGPVDMVLSPTGFTMVIGPNGAGKTSLLRLMHGLQRCTGGTVQARARGRQSFVFQAPIMLRRSVLDNLALPLRLRGAGRRAARQQAQAFAPRFGLAALLGDYAPRLSMGEQQKLALARALITAPEILFLDEPCASLDGRATREIEAILQAQSGVHIVMSTHDMGQARRLARKVVFLHRGQVIEQRPAAEFFNAPRSPQARAFLKGEIVE